MIDFFSSWAEQIVITVVVCSIIEMILPHNKNSKYIKMIIGIYILFTIVFPIINKGKTLDIDDFNLNSYIENYNTYNHNSIEVNQSSMDERLKELYTEELENTVKEKIFQEGFNVLSCKVDANFSDKKEEQGIKKINIVLSHKLNNVTNKNVQNVDKIQIDVGLDKKNINREQNEETNIVNSDIKHLKDILSSYYEIDENKINISIK